MNISIKKHFMEAPQYANHTGYIALMTVLAAGLVAASITVSLLLLGVSQTKTAIISDQSERAKSLANACAEEALQQIRDQTSYTGADTLTFGADSCTYTIADLGGENRQISAAGNVSTTVRKVSITISAISPLITISSWQEVADF